MSNGWPAFDIDRDAPTFALLHLASQMLGKLRVAHAPWANHGWHVTLIPVAEGLAMPPIAANGKRFELVLDLCAHAIVLRTSSGIAGCDSSGRREHRRASPRPGRNARPERPSVQFQRPPQ